MKRKMTRVGLSTSLFLFILSSGRCLDGREPDQVPDAAAGRSQYEKHCVACHQPDGSGAKGGGPPLAGSSWVKGPESRLIRIVLHGVRGSIEVNGETYNREMLGFGQVVTEGEIAALLSYVRSQWGDIDVPVREETVRRIRRDTQDRTTYWTVDELLRIP